jgi:S-adenosyl-L-methionine hydrolase (adenosine-forming)
VEASPVKFITLLTDFGMQDGYSGIMHGVIYRIIPDAHITDLSHAIHPQNILEGGLTWYRSYSFFPEGTVHVAVVDPGVGTNRRPMAARLGKYFFVCPDNGLITPILEAVEKAGEPIEFVHLNQPRFWLPQVSNVFHGRDIFSPIAAHLANGVPLAELGDRITNPVRWSIPRPIALENGWKGEIITIDHFGNLNININEQDIRNPQNLRVRIAGQDIYGLSKTFGDRAPGELIALIDSDHSLAIAVVNGNAARTLNIDLGEPVEVTW